MGHAALGTLSLGTLSLTRLELYKLDPKMYLHVLYAALETLLLIACTRKCL